MKRNTTTFLIAAVTFAAVAVFAYTLIHALWYAPETEVSVAPNASSTAPAPSESQLPSSTVPGDAPLSIQIPKLTVDAHVQKVGINTNGNMSSPSNFTDVGWYKYGTVPGEIGSAVIDGHVDNGLALPGVFKHLSDIDVGDDVYVTMKSGKVLHYIVQSVNVYGYKTVPDSEIFTGDDQARLNLITCDGSFIKGERTYDHRLVVYTVLAGVEG